MHIANEDQADYWGKSPSGAKWLTYEDQMDHMLSPVLDLVLDRAELEPGMQVLDIGCGTGASTVTAARQVGPNGHVLGADISKQFLERAKARATAENVTNTSFEFADAQVTAFETGARDAAISRFGVMFFEDSVAAFGNIGSALKPGGRMTFAAWGPLAENPWFRVPHVAATTHLGHPPKHGRYAPGPLAFHDINHVTEMMSNAGLTDISADPVALRLPGLETVEATAALCTRVGPAARVIAHFNGTEGDAEIIQKAVGNVFAEYAEEGSVGIPAVINLYQARLPANP